MLVTVAGESLGEGEGVRLSVELAWASDTGPQPVEALSGPVGIDGTPAQAQYAAVLAGLDMALRRHPGAIVLLTDDDRLRHELQGDAVPSDEARVLWRATRRALNWSLPDRWKVWAT